MDINIELINQVIMVNDNNMKKTQKKKINITIIKEYDFFLQNEIKNNKIIKNIKNYYNYFNIILNTEFLKVDDINKNINIIKNFVDNFNFNKKYCCVEYNCIENDIIYLKTFFKSIKTSKYFIFHLIDSYTHLLEGLLLLDKNNICHFNISNSSILFNINSLKPYICDFNLAFDTNVLVNTIKSNYDFNFLLKLLNKYNNYTLKPIELHLLYFILNNNLITLSYSNIEEIIQNYIKNIEIFKLFSEKYKKDYYEAALDFFKVYVNENRNTIIIDILTFIDTWDNFSLSIIYLYLIGNTIRYLSLQNTIINEIAVFLNRNIHANPKKRLNIQKLNENMCDLMKNNNNFDFIKNIDQNRFNILVNSL